MKFSRDKAFYARVFRLTGFIALQNVTVCMVGLIDNVMIGAYSQEALAGIALANQIQFLLQMLIGGVGEGAAVLTAQYWGEGRLSPIRRVTAIALEAAALFGIVFFAAARFWPDGMLGLLTPDAASVAQGASYLRIICYSYAFFCVGSVMGSVQRSIENVGVGMVASVLALLVNVFGNWVLIFGNLGVAPMGVRGAAVATLVARMVECGVILWYAYGIDRKLAIAFRNFRKLDYGLLRDFQKVALPVILSGGSWGIAMTVQTGILGHLGASAIAANSIASSLFQVISVLAYGMASASAILIGKAVGSGDHARLREYVNSLQALYAAVGIVSGAALFMAKDVLLSFYAISTEAMEMARRFMTVLSITIVGTGYQCSCLTGIVRGGGNTKFVFYNDLIFMWGIVLPVSLLAAFVLDWDPVWVFFCLKSDQIIKCLVAAWQVNSYRWVKKVTRAEA